MFTGLTATQIIIVLAAIIVSMTIHEAMHGYAAHALGDTTAKDMGRLTLNPLKHIDIITTVLLPIVLILLGAFPIFAAKPVPFDPSRVKFGEYGAALVALAGPFTNFALAVAAALVLRAFGGDINQSSEQAILIFLEVNVAFFIFNMIPFPPLDGSRLLYAFAPDWLREIMVRIESFGFMAILIFIILFIQYGGGGLYTLEAKVVQFLVG
jgi:Zn-dependent protease